MMDFRSIPLSFGLLFLVVGLASFIDATTDADVEPRSAWSLGLILMGVTAVVSAVRRSLAVSRSEREVGPDPGGDPHDEPPIGGLERRDADPVASGIDRVDGSGGRSPVDG